MVERPPEEQALLRPQGMRVLLTKKLAEFIDGVDLSSRHVGEILDVSPVEARLLVAEQWAIPDRRSPDRPMDWPPKTE
jgi:hypothetical protein